MVGRGAIADRQPTLALEARLMSVILADPRIGGEVPERIVILRALQLGDLLCAVPAFRAIRSAWPAAEIVLIGLPWAQAFAERFGIYLDGFRAFPGYPGLPETPPDEARYAEFAAAIRAERFDLAIQLHGSGSFVNQVVADLAARRAAGFFLPGDVIPDPELFIPWPETGLEINRLLTLVDALGVPRRGDHLEFPVRTLDRDTLHAIAGVADLVPGAYICVHPGASVPARRWPAEHFAAVADALADRDFRIVLTGSAAEADLTRAVAGAMRHPALDLAGRTELGALAALIDGSRLLVSNDTGVAHLAVARKVPSVIISTGTNPDRWAPIDRSRHRVLCDDRGVTVAAVEGEAKALLDAHEDHHQTEPTPALDPDLADPFGDLKG